MTDINACNPLTGEWNDSLAGDFISSNVNVGEAVSVVMTPLTWSIFGHSFSDLTFFPGWNVVVNICGGWLQGRDPATQNRRPRTRGWHARNC